MTNNKPMPEGNQFPVYAVLTGDVVASSKQPPSALQEIMQRLRKGAEQFSKTFPDSVYGRLDVYSGDGFQLLMSDLGRSLRAALFLRATVRSYSKAKVDTRIAVAWGRINESTLNPDRISESTGAAFTESGRALKGLKSRYRLVWQPGQHLTDVGFLKSAVSLLDELAGHWTARQAEIIALALLELSQEDIALAIGIRQPTVNRTLRRGSWRGIEDFLQDVNNSL